MPKSKKEEDKKILAFLTTFLSIIGFILAIIFWKDNKYVMHYAKQSLVVFIVGAVLSAAASILEFIPIIGKLINFAAGIIILLAWIISWVYALSGEMKKVPVIGKWGRSFRF